MKQAKTAKKRDLTDPRLRGYKLITPKEVGSVSKFGCSCGLGRGCGKLRKHGGKWYEKVKVTKLRCVWPFLPPLLFLAFIAGSPPHMKSDQIIHVPTLQGPHPTKSVVKWCHLPHSACLPCLPPFHGGAHMEVSARKRLHGGVCTDMSGQRCQSDFRCP